MPLPVLSRRLRVLILAVTGLLAAADTAAACIWYYGTSVDGGDAQTTNDPPEWYVAALRVHPAHDARAGAAVAPEPPPTADFKLRSDHAATLMHQGRAPRAVEILEAIEAEHPGEYVIATNLGTAYELAGDDTRALRWIQEGIRRNPDSHGGTEWLHVRILEAKLALARDPRWLETHTVLGVDFGDLSRPVAPATWPDGREPFAVEDALYYQLTERTALVPPPDPIVADLLVALGDVLATTVTAEHAIAVYDVALSYQPRRAALVVARQGRLQQMVAERRRRAMWRWRMTLIGVGAGLVVSVALAVGWVRRRRRRRRAAA